MMHGKQLTRNNCINQDAKFFNYNISQDIEKLSPKKVKII